MTGHGHIAARLFGMDERAWERHAALGARFSKMWLCDRMVWLYEDIKDRHPAYAAWLRSGKEQVR